MEVCEHTEVTGTLLFQMVSGLLEGRNRGAGQECVGMLSWEHGYRCRVIGMHGDTVRPRSDRQDSDVNLHLAELPAPSSGSSGSLR
ncbi:hypothetical protein chiPu_0025265 [Chiloscyllium punctatum]|uniref:Uncharacterized protein n=1 Tax=Chiloscyllium punctatum TaxID=137246 RepID=A0A401TEW0_CHIPU|nr:hypothetical protein [Chiloscyllium punctatum]